MGVLKKRVDLFEAICPGCGDGCLDTTGEGDLDDRAWCEDCGWEGTCRDLIPDDEENQ